MKKFIVFSIMFLEMANIVNAVVLEPEWTEFCPPK